MNFAEELASARLAPSVTNSGATDYISSFSILPTENIYEFAAKLLFFAVRWARSIHSFLQVIRVLTRDLYINLKTN